MNSNAIAAQFDLQTSWFLHALENVSEGESILPFSENLNPIKWVAGHILDARITILGIVTGMPVMSGYKQLFGKGTGGKVDERYPSLEQIRTDWKAISQPLIVAVQELSGEQLQSQAPFQTSIPDGTLQGLIAYFAIHESFHLGQLSIHRKLAGKAAMSMSRI